MEEENQQPLKEENQQATQEEKQEKKKPQPPISRMKSREVLFFPNVNSSSVLFPAKYWKDIDGNVRWDVEYISMFIFPSHLSPVFYKCCVEFLKFLLKNPEGINGDGIADFLRSHNFSSASMYNAILPKLHRLGIIERRRLHGERGRKMLIELSTKFSINLSKLSKEWNEIVATAKAETEERETQKNKFTDNNCI